MVDAAQEYEALIQFLYLAPVGLAQTNAHGDISMINPISAQLLMPLSVNGDLNNLFVALESVAPDLRQLSDSFRPTHGLICDGIRLQVSAGVRGRSDPQILSLSLLKLDETRLMAVLNDVSLQVKREKLLKQNEAWLNAILTGVTDYAIVNLDARGQIADWNPSIDRVTGLSASQVVGRSFSVLRPADAMTPERVSDRLKEADDNGWSLEDGWHTRPDGSRFWGSTMIAPLYLDSAGTTAMAPLDRFMLPGATLEPAYCLVIRDITDKHSASEANRRAQSCDHLTGLNNRRTFFDAAEIEVERWRKSPRKLTLIMFDADNFKQVNDRYGHAGGDAVLKHFASVLESTFREIDIVARVGGEEFAVLLPSAGIDDAAAAAERVRAAIAASVVHIDGLPVRYSVSGGLAAMDGETSGLDELMKRADAALYRAKEQGRDRLCV